MAAPVLSHDGTVVNACDSTTGWSGGAVDTELFQQGTGAIGGKAGSGVTAFVVTATAADFSVGGAAEGEHVLIWLTSLTPGKLTTLANGGQRLRVGTSATVYGDHYLAGNDSYIPVGASFIPYAVDMARDFDAVAGGLTLTGNPAQLSACDTFGAANNADSGIMGNFANFLIDQISRGFGIQLVDGDAGTPGTFEAMLDYDVTNSFGWLVPIPGGIGAQGKLLLGSTATACYVRSDGESVVFLDRPVAAGHYELLIDNASSDVDISNGSISAANPASAPWRLAVTAGTFTSSGQTYRGAEQGVDLNSTSTLTGCRVAESGTVVQNGATLDGGTVIDGSTAVVALEADSVADLAGITLSNNDRALDLGTGAGPFTVDQITFTGNTMDIRVNNAADVTVNLSGGSNAATAENIGAGNVTLVSAVSVTFDPVNTGSAVTVAKTADQTVMHDDAPTTGTSSAFSYDGADAGTEVLVVIVDVTFGVVEFAYTLPATDTTVPISQLFDPTFANP